MRFQNDAKRGASGQRGGVLGRRSVLGDSAGADAIASLATVGGDLQQVERLSQPRRRRQINFPSFIRFADYSRSTPAAHGEVEVPNHVTLHPVSLCWASSSALATPRKPAVQIGAVQSIATALRQIVSLARCAACHGFARHARKNRPNLYTYVLDGSASSISRFSGQITLPPAAPRVRMLSCGDPQPDTCQRAARRRLLRGLEPATERSLSSGRPGSSFSLSLRPPFLCRQADAMEVLDTALKDLIQLAKPPAALALRPPVLRACIDQRLEAWKQDLFARFKQQMPASEKKAQKLCREFAQEVKAYNAWLWDGLKHDRALHHDVYVALVSLRLPSQ